MQTETHEGKYFDYKPSDEELYFVESPFYWMENNPSALVKVSNGYLRLIGEENWQNRAANSILDTVPYDFYTEILTPSGKEPFAKFFENGIKYGTINVGNAESDNFEMLKRMYGSIVYLVLESRAVSANNPRHKRSRHVVFYSEYSLCTMNSSHFYSDENYFHSIKKDDAHKTSWDRTLEKMYRNGFRVGGGSSTQYADEYIPSKNEFYANKSHESLDSEDLINLLWKVVSDSHLESRIVSNPSHRSLLAFHIFQSNIIGFGWLPCLFAKQNLNELDRCIIYLYEHGTVHNSINENEITWDFEQQCKRCDDNPKGSHQQIVKFKDSNGKFSKLLLQDVVKIDDMSNKFKITLANGRTIESEFCDLCMDYPEVLNFTQDFDGNVVAKIKFACNSEECLEVDWNDLISSPLKYIESPTQFNYCSDGTRDSTT